MKPILQIILTALLLTTSCNQLPSIAPTAEEDEKFNNIEVVETRFAADYKTFSVDVKVPDTIGLLSLTDTAGLRIETEERSSAGVSADKTMQPVLTHIENIRMQELSDNQLTLLLLVDLTLSEEDIEAERRAVETMRQWFPSNNLRIAFMSDKSVGATMPLTDYVMATYFKKSHSKKYLYRSILQKREEIANWTKLKPSQKGLVVFSDGDVYEGDTPIDPDHYELQERILRAGNKGGYSTVEYVNMGHFYEEGEGNEAKAVMEQLTQHSKGLYLDHFNWHLLLKDILETFDVDYADYRLTFVNPDKKVYVGKTNHLDISIYEDSKLLMRGCAKYNIGDIYNPIIIHGLSPVQVLLQGIVITLLLLLLAYLVLQLAIPYVSYRLFKRRYVTRYTHQGMVFNGLQVSQSCYLCKAPFEEGDLIVARCKHVLHKECWDDNEYKCPEHGRHCKEGSHYYNARNLFDRRNAPFYARWVMVAIVAGLMAWLCFSVFVHRPSGALLNDIMLSIHDLKPGTIEAQDAYDKYAKHLNIMPIFGLSVNLCLTFALSLFCHRQPLKLRLQWCAVKALVASFLGYVLFLLVCIVSIIFNMEESGLIDWTPWVLNGAVIMVVSTVFTRVRLRLKYLAYCGAATIVVMYVWSAMFFDSKADNREILMLCFIVYSVALFLSIAFAAPKSERYFLHVEGALKPLDVALYKWMRTAPDYEVSIGKSVDCNLQMTWDFSDIAPRQALITRQRGHLYLVAVEEGIVVEGRPLPVDARVALYHGRAFTIGQTIFTYIEKDA